MNGMSCSWMWSTGDFSVTHAFDFPPTFTLGTISIAKYGGDDGTGRAGILSYRTRQADGSDATVTLSGPGSGGAPTSFSADQVTNVVFELWTDEVFAYATPIVTFW